MAIKRKVPTLPAMLLVLLTGSAALASDINQGRTAYQRHCLMCHGENGSARMAGAPDFNRGQGLRKSDQALLARIEQGNKACPAYRGILNQQEIFDVIAYIRTLF